MRGTDKPLQDGFPRRPRSVCRTFMGDASGCTPWGKGSPFLGWGRGRTRGYGDPQSGLRVEGPENTPPQGVGWGGSQGGRTVLSGWLLGARGRASVLEREAVMAARCEARAKQQ